MRKQSIMVRKVETELAGNRSCRHSQEAETANWYSASLLHRMVLPTFIVGLFFLVKPFCKCPHRYSQRYALMVALNPTKLTIKDTHRRRELPKSLQLSLPKSPFCFPPLWIQLCHILLKYGIVQHLCFWEWLISSGTVTSRFIKACCRLPQTCLPSWCSITFHCMDLRC